MQQTLKRYFKLGLLLLSISLTLVNCQKDDIEPTSQGQKYESKLVVKNLKKDNILLNKELVQNLTKLTTTIESNNSKLIENNNYGFVVDTESAVYMEKFGYHSYTFSVYRNQPNDYVENIIFSLQDDGSYKTFLMKYGFNESQKIELISNKKVTGSYQVLKEEIVVDSNLVDTILGKEVSCETQTHQYHITPDTNETFEFTQGSECHHDGTDGDEQCTVYFITIVKCNGTGGGPTVTTGVVGGGGPTGTTTQTIEINDTENNDSEGSGETQSNTVTITDPITGYEITYNTDTGEVILVTNITPIVITTPIINYPSYLISVLGYKYDTIVSDYINNQLDTVISVQLYNFLQNNNCSDDAKNLAQQAIEALMTYTETDYPGKDLGYPYSWWTNNDFIMNSGNFEFPGEQSGGPNLQLNEEEVRLLKIYPGQFLKHLDNAYSAFFSAQDYSLSFPDPNSSLNGGKSDAFRHGLWNALDVPVIGSALTNLFTTAHEYGESPDGRNYIMDMHNNTQGNEIGQNYLFPTQLQLEDAVSQGIANGIFLYINTNVSQDPIPTNQ